MAQTMNALEKLSHLRSTITNWPLVSVDKLGLRKVNEYHTRSGIKILCRAKSTDINEAVVVLSGLEYPERYLKIKEGSMVFDIGANIGAFTLLFNHINRGKKYQGFAFEPFKNNAELLRKNLALNGVRQFKVIDAAVSDSDGYVNLDTNTDYDSVAISTTGNTPVKSYTLTSFCHKHNITQIDLLKMDVEGAEYAILENDLDFIQKTVRSLILEYHILGGNDRAWVVNKLKSYYHVEDLHQGSTNGVLYAVTKHS